MPVAKRSPRDRPQPALEAAVVEVGRDRQLPVAVGDERASSAGTTSHSASTNASIGSTAPRRLNASAPSNGWVERSHERRGHVADVLQVLSCRRS